jgi:hypothetical protein
MFVRYPNLRREEFSQVIYEDFQIICEQTKIDSFAESELWVHTSAQFLPKDIWREVHDKIKSLHLLRVRH